MEGLARGQLRDLLAATEAVGDDDGGWAGGLDGGEQALVGDGLGDFEFVGLEAEGAGHAAAAGLDGARRCAGFAQKRDFAGRAAEDGLVMAVAVDKDVRALKAAGRQIRRAAARASRRAARPLAQAFGAGIVGEKLEQLVFEDAGAAWLEKDEGQAGFDLRGHAVEDTAR
jgi:hypothetical protein